MCVPRGTRVNFSSLIFSSFILSPPRKNGPALFGALCGSRAQLTATQSGTRRRPTCEINYCKTPLDSCSASPRKPFLKSVQGMYILFEPQEPSQHRQDIHGSRGRGGCAGTMAPLSAPAPPLRPLMKVWCLSMKNKHQSGNRLFLLLPPPTFSWSEITVLPLLGWECHFPVQHA